MTSQLIESSKSDHTSSPSKGQNVTYVNVITLYPSHGVLSNQDSILRQNGSPSTRRPEKRFGKMEIRVKIETTQTTLLLKSTWILRRVLEIRGGLLLFHLFPIRNLFFFHFLISIIPAFFLEFFTRLKKNFKRKSLS